MPALWAAADQGRPCGLDLPGVVQLHLPEGLQYMSVAQKVICAIILGCLVGIVVLPQVAGLLGGIAIAAIVVGAAFFSLPPGGGEDDG